MLSDRRLLLPGLAAIALGLAAMPAETATRSCGAPPHAKKVLTTPAMRIVSVRVDTVHRRNRTHVVGLDHLACARPRGRLRRIGTFYRQYATTGSVTGLTPIASGFTSFGSSAGTFVITRIREADLAGNYAERTYRVVNVATGRRYRYFHHLQSEGTDRPEPAPPVSVRLDAGGRLAAILSSPTDEGYSAPPVGRSQVVAFSSAGVRTVLDEAPAGAIPSTSLTLSDGVIGWTNAGQAKSAPAP